MPYVAEYSAGFAAFDRALGGPFDRLRSTGFSAPRFSVRARSAFISTSSVLDVFIVPPIGYQMIWQNNNLNLIYTMRMRRVKQNQKNERCSTIAIESAKVSDKNAKAL